MAVRVHKLANEAAARLGCADRFHLYLTPLAHPHLNAQAMLNETPFAIRLVGPVARLLDDGALAALIGHEFGHWLAHGPRANPPSMVLKARELGASGDMCRLGTIASEITADRVSLLAVGGEIEAAVRLEVAIQTLDSPLALGVNELGHLASQCRLVEAREATIFKGDYPSSAFRLFASWLFWRSEVHRELTGVGPGDIALREVDGKLRAICDEALRNERVFRWNERPGDESSGVPYEPVSLEAVAHASPWSTLQERVRNLKSSAEHALRQVVSAWASPQPPSSTADDGGVLADELDDLEERFRQLERNAVLSENKDSK